MQEYIVLSDNHYKTESKSIDCCDVGAETKYEVLSESQYEIKNNSLDCCDVDGCDTGGAT